MSRRTSSLARFALLCASIGGISAPSARVFAEEPGPRIEIDHKSGEVWYTGNSLRIRLDTPAPKTVPLRPGDELRILVKNSNRLLYSYGQEVKEEDFVDKTALFKYLGGLQGGITGLLGLMAPAEVVATTETVVPFKVPTALVDMLAALRVALAATEEDARIAARLESVYFEALQASETGFRSEAGLDSNAGPKAVKAVLRSQGLLRELDDESFLSTAAKRAVDMRAQAWRNGLALEEARGGAVKARDAFAKSPEATTEAGKKVLTETDKALDTIPTKALDLAREFAKLAVLFERLEKWLREPATQYTETPESIRYRWDKTRNVAITADKRKDLADKIAYSERKFEKVTFVVSPEWYIQPSIGAGLIWADNLIWPEWTTLEENGAKTVASKGMADKRFQFFPLLSLTSPALSCLASWHSEAENSGCDGWKRGKAVSLDLGWNASTSEPAYLVGGSLVLSRQFKIGGGVVWQRRQVLNGVEPGDPVPASGIPLRQSYPPAPYLMFSILGWPPFTSGQ